MNAVNDDAFAPPTTPNASIAPAPPTTPPAPPAPYAPPQQQETDSSAIVAFTLALLGFLIITAVAGAVIAHRSLATIRRENRAGEGLVKAALVLAYMWLTVALLSTAFYVGVHLGSTAS